MNVAVKISDVSKRYGDILALDRVSLDIGEVMTTNKEDL